MEYGEGGRREGGREGGGREGGRGRVRSEAGIVVSDVHVHEYDVIRDHQTSCDAVTHGPRAWSLQTMSRTSSGSYISRLRHEEPS